MGCCFLMNSYVHEVNSGTKIMKTRKLKIKKIQTSLLHSKNHIFVLVTSNILFDLVEVHDGEMCPPVSESLKLRFFVTYLALTIVFLLLLFLSSVAFISFFSDMSVIIRHFSYFVETIPNSSRPSFVICLFTIPLIEGLSVILGRRKSSSMLELNGYIPFFSKILQILLIGFTNSATSYIVKVFPGLPVNKLFMACFYLEMETLLM